MQTKEEKRRNDKARYLLNKDELNKKRRLANRSLLPRNCYNPECGNTIEGSRGKKFCKRSCCARFKTLYRLKFVDINPPKQCSGRDCAKIIQPLRKDQRFCSRHCADISRGSYSKEYYISNKAKVLARCADYYKQNRLRQRVKNARWSKNNYGRKLEIEAKRRSQKLRLKPKIRLSTDEWEAIKKDFDYRCAYCYCLPDELTQDHMIPLSRGGDHIASNIAPACRSCNCKKGSKTVEEFMG